MGELGAFEKDLESTWSQLKYEEKHLRLKRRWLMGLADSESDPQQLRRPKFLKYRALPESLLREDDIFYETVKDFVQEAYGACDLESRPYFASDDGLFFDASSIEKILLSGLDDMTSKGLFLLTKLLNRGSVNFEKSRSKMKKTIRELLPTVLSKRDNCSVVDILKELSQLLCNPHNFKKKHGVFFTFISLYHRIAARKILDELEEMPHNTLLAMHRKLRGVQFDIQNLTPQKSGWNRDVLIRQVRRTSQMMLSELGKGDSLQEPLAKAMAVAGLSLKLTRGSQELSLTEFFQFSPEIKTLQDEITRTILLLDTKVRFTELKRMQLLLGPDAEISNRSLRTAIRKMLINFLFECNDMRAVPKYLLDALAVVNKSSESILRKSLPQEEIEEDVECILGVSAQAKQVVWDMLPGHGLDRDFDDAYLEYSEESDGGCRYDNIDDDVEQWQPDASSSDNFSGVSSQIESTGESMQPHCSETATATYKKNDPYSSSQLQDSRFDDTSDIKTDEYKVDSRDMFGTPTTHEYKFDSKSLIHGQSTCRSTAASEHEHISEKDPIISSHEKNTCKNQYLLVQEACDETSVFAYNLVGQMLHTSAQMEGLDVSRDGSLYLRGKYPEQDEYRDATTTGKHFSLSKTMEGSVLMRLIEERMTFLSKSEKEKLKALWGLS